MTVSDPKHAPRNGLRNRKRSSMMATGTEPVWMSRALAAVKLRGSARVGPYGRWEVTVADLLMPVGGGPTCREIDILRAVRRSGWLAYWRPGIMHRQNVTLWPNEVASISKIIKAVPPAAKETLRAIREDIRGPTKDGFGWPDLIAWAPGAHRVRFVEVKGAAERMRPTQLRWIEAALRLGEVRHDDVLVARWK